ncbi:MAG: AraC family transcriptional regulator [Gorillibacterium sp.]|nr:AraC family transcriptional regulator [Gorillibacterium sp.]
MIEILNVPMESKLGLNSELIYYYSGSARCEPGHVWGPGMRDHYVIHYILAGKGVLRTSGLSFSLEAGQGFIIVPGTLVYYEADLTDPWHYVWIGFSGIKADHYLQRASLNAISPIFSYSHNSRLAECMREIGSVEHSGGSSELRLTGLLYNLLSILIDCSSEDSPGRTLESTRDEYVRKAIEYVHKNYSRSLRISELASYVGIDRKYLHSIFKQLTHMSPQQFLIRCRLEKACELMRDNDLLIGDIARSVGYEDPLLFSKMFSKVKGLSPKQWKQANKREN